MNDGGEVTNSKSSPRAQRWRKLVLLIVVVAVSAGLALLFREELTLEALAEREAALRSWQRDQPVAAYGAAFLVYVVVTGLSIPGAAVLTLAYAWFFGFWRGLALVSFASTTGATCAFLISRYLLHDAVQRWFGDRLARVNEAFRREGAVYLLSLRLFPAMPFFVLNVLMGLTPVRVPTYWWASQLGMLPGTAVFAYAGSQVPSLAVLAERGIGSIATPQVLIALGVLAVFPLAVRWVWRRWNRTRTGAAS